MPHPLIGSHWESIMVRGKRVAFYVRVSTGSQTVENQLQELTKAAQQREWTVVEVYSDSGFSGGKGRDKRPEFDRLCRDAVAGKFDIVAAWSVDRLGRSVLHLSQLIEDLRAAGIGLFLLKQGLDSETPTGRAMLGMCSVFAELEREIIRERIHAGLARVKARGRRLGRPQISRTLVDRIRRLRADRPGHSVRRIAAEVGVGSTTVQRVLAGATVK
jgi:DNA invertase Pin-like site-specific DNA recombinase